MALDVPPMDKHQFYAAALARDRELERRSRWIIGGMLVLIAAPLLLFSLLPKHYFPLPQHIRWVLLVIVLAGLIALIYVSSYVRKTTAERHSLLCPHCRASFEGSSLVALGFTDSCISCGTVVFGTPNSSSSGREVGASGADARRST